MRAVDALVTNRVWTAMGLDPATTLHDLRWGEHYTGNGVDDFVWVLLISGAAPAVAFHRRLRGRIQRTPAADVLPAGRRHAQRDQQAGRDRLEPRVTSWMASCTPIWDGRRWLSCRGRKPSAAGRSPRPQWPIMHAVLHGVTRDQMMARHKANHLNVVYAPSAEEAEKGLAAKAAMLAGMGIEVHLCGDVLRS